MTDSEISGLNNPFDADEIDTDKQSRSGLYVYSARNENLERSFP